MSRFRIKKQPLIAVAGIVWLLAGLNVAVLGVRAAIDMRGVAAIIFLALAGGAIAIFCAFHPMFSKLVKKKLSASPTWRASVITWCASSTARATS